MTKIVSCLRIHRKRADFEQEEVGYLVGSPRGTDRSHYEKFLHEPTLRAAMAFEVIYRTRLKDLFPGMYNKVEYDVVKRARKMLRRLPARYERHTKWRSLLAIAEPSVEDLRWEPISTL